VSLANRNSFRKHGSNLLAQHLADLHRSGLSDATIAACGFYSISDPVQINTYLRWRGGERFGPCLAIPFRDRQGKTNGYVRLKPDKPRKDKDGKPVRYESAKGQCNRAYFPPGTIAALSNSGKPLLITEGEKKAARADQDGFASIGLTSVYSWQKKRTDKGQLRELIADLAGVAWNGRRMTIVYDSDATDKEGVVWGRISSRRSPGLLRCPSRYGPAARCCQWPEEGAG
jgi:hypothetical protein